MSTLLLIPWFRWEPIIVELGRRERTVYPFQIMVAIAIIVAIAVAVRFARRNQRSVELTLDFALHVLAFAFPISYLLNGILYKPDTFLHVLRNPSQALDHNLGWTMYGGIIGGIIGAWVWKWRRKASILEIGDAFAYAGPFGWCIARVGCFGVHDHPGKVSDFVLAVADYQTGSLPYLPRHDLGLYDAILLAAIAATFLVLSRHPRKPGFYFAMLALLHAPARFFLDFLRAPLAEGGDIRYAGLTASQYISIGFFITGVLIMRRARACETAPT